MEKHSRKKKKIKGRSLAYVSSQVRKKCGLIIKTKPESYLVSCYSFSRKDKKYCLQKYGVIINNPCNQTSLIGVRSHKCEKTHTWSEDGFPSPAPAQCAELIRGARRHWRNSYNPAAIFRSAYKSSTMS